MPGERAGPFGQCSGSTRHDSIGVRLLMFQKNSALAQWFRARTENARGTRKTMIVALARKLLIALWRLVREGVVPDGVVLRPAQ
jgi:transposase